MFKKIEKGYYLIFNVLYGYYNVKDRFNKRHNLIINAMSVGSFVHYLNVINLIEFFASAVNSKNIYWFQIISPVIALTGVFVFWTINYIIFQRSKRYIYLYNEYLEKTTKTERILYQILTIIYIIFSFASIIYKPWLVWM